MRQGAGTGRWIAFPFVPRHRIPPGIVHEDPKKISPERASVHARVFGRVQGVGFRYFTARIAEDFGLSGHVMNCRDGSVEILVEGDRDALERFLGRIRQGPSGANVERVEERWGPSTGRLVGFTIRFGG